MNKHYSLGRFEYFTVAIAIGIIAAVGLNRYVHLAEQARNLRFEVISHHFLQAVVNARVHWLLEKATSPVSPTVNQQDDPITLLYFSPQGWPAAVLPGPAERQGLTAADCKALWDSLLQNPPPLSAQPEQRGAYPYHVAVQGHLCRYFWLGTPTGEYYFDYSIDTGQVRLVIP